MTRKAGQILHRFVLKGNAVKELSGLVEMSYLDCGGGDTDILQTVQNAIYISKHLYINVYTTKLQTVIKMALHMLRK